MIYKDEAVKMMNDYINDMNRRELFRMNLAEEQIEEALSTMQSELSRVNGELYDMLKENGVIQ